MKLSPEWLRWAKRFYANEQGAAFIIVAICSVVLVTAVAGAIELSRYSSAKSQVRNALDQSVLAAAAAYDGSTDNSEYARNFFTTNLASNPDLKVQEFSVYPNATHTVWYGKTEVIQPLSFGKFLGLEEMTITHDTKVAWDNSHRSEVVAMVDVSGTMCANFKRTRTVTEDGIEQVDIDFVPDRTCNKLDMMVEALKNIVNIGVGYSEAAPDPIFKVGVVPFTFKVNLPNPGAVPDFLLDAERRSAASGGDGTPDYFTNLSDANEGGGPIPKVLPLRNIANQADKDAFMDEIDRLVSGNDREFGRAFMKRSSLGAHISALMLDPRYHDMFGGIPPAPFGTQKTDKIVIMMTDSANLGCCYTNWPEQNFRNHYIYSYNPDHRHLVGTSKQAGICKQMKEAGIQIYTVLLDVEEEDMDERGNEIVTAFESCASQPENAFRIPRNDRNALKTAYETIGAALLKLRIVK